MNTKSLTTMVLTVIVTAVGIYGLTQAHADLPVAAVVLSYVTVAAIFGLAAGDATTVKRF